MNEKAEEIKEPTARVVITIYDREVEIEGDNLERLKNSIIHRIDLMLKRAAKKAKREVNRAYKATQPKPERVSPIQTTEKINTADPVGPIQKVTLEPKISLAERLARLGNKLNKREEIDNA